MTSSIESLDVARNSSHDAVRAGFEELARYLHATPLGSQMLTSTEATLSRSSAADDPARAGLDELERTMQAVRRDLQSVA